MSFRGESQNSYGGMVSDFYIYYVDKNYFVHYTYDPYITNKKLISIEYKPLERCKKNECMAVAEKEGYCRPHYRMLEYEKKYGKK